MADKKQDAAAFHRNIEPITQVLRKILPVKSANVLEVGSGSGQHTARFAGVFPHLTFQPSDADPANHASIKAWAEHFERENIQPPITLDATNDGWFGETQPEKFAAILCFNVIHISPWETTLGLFGGAARHLAPKGRLILYGPFRVRGKHTAGSNVAFEKWLKSQNKEFGVRDIGEVEQVAKNNSLVLKDFIGVPANNFIPVIGWY